MGNEMNFLNQHLQTTSILLQKQLDLARDSLHACSVQFARRCPLAILILLPSSAFRSETNDSTINPSLFFLRLLFSREQHQANEK